MQKGGSKGSGRAGELARQLSKHTYCSMEEGTNALLFLNSNFFQAIFRNTTFSPTCKADFFLLFIHGGEGGKRLRLSWKSPFIILLSWPSFMQCIVLSIALTVVSPSSPFSPPSANANANANAAPPPSEPSSSSNSNNSGTTPLVRRSAAAFWPRAREEKEKRGHSKQLEELV